MSAARQRNGLKSRALSPYPNCISLSSKWTPWLCLRNTFRILSHLSHLPPFLCHHHLLSSPSPPLILLFSFIFATMTAANRTRFLACVVLLLTVHSAVLAVPMPDHNPGHAGTGTVGLSKPGMGLFSFDRLFQRLLLRVMAQPKPKPSKGNGQGNGKPSTSTHSGYTPKPSDTLSTSGTKTATGSAGSTSIKPTNGTSPTDPSTTSEKPSTTAGTPSECLESVPLF